MRPDSLQWFRQSMTWEIQIAKRNAYAETPLGQETYGKIFLTLAIIVWVCTGKGLTKVGNMREKPDNRKNPRDMHKQKLHRKSVRGIRRRKFHGHVERLECMGRLGRVLLGTYFIVYGFKTISNHMYDHAP